MNLHSHDRPSHCLVMEFHETILNLRIYSPDPKFYQGQITQKVTFLECSPLLLTYCPIKFSILVKFHENIQNPYGILAQTENFRKGR